MKKKIFITLGILIVLVIFAYFAFPSIRPNGGNSTTQSSYQTEPITIGNVSVLVGGTGSVRANQTAVLTWQTSGKVGEVLVKKGQEVAANEVLAQLDPGSLSQTILQAQIDLIDAQTALDELMEVTPLDISQAEADVDQYEQTLDDLLHPSELTIAQAEQDVVSAQDALDTAQKEYDQLKYDRGSAEDVSIANSDYLLAQQKADDMQELYNLVPGDPETNLAKAQSLSNLNSAIADRDHALAVLNWYKGTPSEFEVTEKETNLAVAIADLADAQKTLEDLKSPSEVDVKLAEAQLSDAQDKLDELKNGPSQDDITIAETRIIQAQAVLIQSYLEAPFSGVIADVQVLPNDLVSTGDVAFQIDDLSTLLVDVDISEVDINQVQVGQPATLTFDAIPGKDFNGLVTDIAMSGSIASGTVNFNVTVEIQNPSSEIKPGMTAAVNITVNQLADVLLIPNRAVRTEEGVRVIYLLKDNQPVAVTVTLGASANNYSQIIDGEVKVGDIIILNPSTLQTMIPGGGLFGGRGEQ